MDKIESTISPMLSGRTLLAGAILIVGGLLLNAALPTLIDNDYLGRYGFLTEVILDSVLGLPLLGVVLISVGSILDRRHLNVHQSRMKGLGCLAAALISFVLFVTTGNVHGWTFFLILPAFAGLFSGVVYLLKRNQRQLIM